MRFWCMRMETGSEGKTTLWSLPAAEFPHHSVPGKTTTLPSWLISRTVERVAAHFLAVMLKSFAV